MTLDLRNPAWRPLVEKAFDGLVIDERLVSRLRPATPVDTNGATVDRLLTYLDLVTTWNARVDLTAARSAEELVDLSVADAWVLASAGPEGQWLDVGSGAGAPGLVLAILRPEWPITLVEPRGKRVSFLRTAIGRIGLAKVQVIRGRSDSLRHGGWDVAVSRATLPPREWVTEGARLARDAVWVLLARDEAPDLPGHEVTIFDYVWPLTGVPRRAARFVRSRRA